MSIAYVVTPTEYGWKLTRKPTVREQRHAARRPRHRKPPPPPVIPIPVKLPPPQYIGAADRARLAIVRSMVDESRAAA